MDVSALQANALAAPTPAGDNREIARQIVGQTFFATLMEIGRESPVEPRYGHGGRGEEIFRAELDRVLVEKASQRFDNGLVDAIQKVLDRHGSKSTEAQGALDDVSDAATAAIDPRKGLQ